MSTRSYICIENSDDKKISGIYCHSDGYVSYVGFFLYNFYDTERKVRELIGLGSLSSLGVRIGHTVDFNRLYTDTNYYEANKMQCVAYCRDRQEHFEVYTPYELYNKLKYSFFTNTQFEIDVISFYKNYSRLFWNCVLYFSMNNLSFDFLFPYSKDAKYDIEEINLVDCFENLKVTTDAMISFS